MAPSRTEVVACQTWLLGEINAVAPDVIVLLGATAAKSLLGSSFRLTAHRSEALRLPTALQPTWTWTLSWWPPLTRRRCCVGRPRVVRRRSRRSSPISSSRPGSSRTRDDGRMRRLPDDHVARLRDGRDIGYAQYGDPDGFPVVNAHGGLACRLDVKAAAVIADAAGIRLISPDRPGIGRPAARSWTGPAMSSNCSTRLTSTGSPSWIGRWAASTPQRSVTRSGIA